MAAGHDPQKAKLDTRRTSLAAKTVAEATTVFLDRHVGRLRSAPTVRRMFESDVLPLWGSRKLEEITRSDVIDLLDRIVDSGRPVAANRVFAAVRKFFNWCASRDLISASPCAGVRAPTEEAGRDRVLSNDELRRVWLAAGRMGFPFGPFIQMLFLTAQRRNEVADMRWNELDLDSAMWLIPKERSKNGQAHHVPLCTSAVTLLRSVPRIGDSAFVFTTTSRTPVSGYGWAKSSLDRVILAGMKKDVADHGGDPEMVTAPPPWRFHDIRRTVTTNLAAMGVEPHVADKILNHAEGTIRGVAAVYNRHAYLDERRRALVAWDRRLQDIVSSKPTDQGPRGNGTEVPPSTVQSADASR